MKENKVEVKIEEGIKLPIHMDIVRGDIYIRIDIDGKNRNHLYISKL